MLVSDEQVKMGVSNALNSLSHQGLIANLSPSCSGRQGTYELLDAGLDAAAEAFGLQPHDVQLVKNAGIKKLNTLLHM